MLTVTTDPDLNSNEVFRTPLRANYTGMKCVGLPRTALEADFLVSAPKQRDSPLGESLSRCFRVSISSVEGSINLLGNRVTVARNGVVLAEINAREIVILGEVHGMMTASDRFDMRSEGSLTGDIVAQRVSLEEGAYFKGSIDIRKNGLDGIGDGS